MLGHGENIQGTNVHVVSALGRTSDGRLISGGWDKTVRVWKGDQPPVIMAGHDIAINAVAGRQLWLVRCIENPGLVHVVSSIQAWTAGTS